MFYFCTGSNTENREWNKYILSDSGKSKAYTGRLISAWKVFVNQKELGFDSSEAPFIEGNTLMIPVYKTAEALGYKVSFDETSETVTINDDYIQKATLTNGSDTAVFEGHLKVIDMSREITLAVPMNIKQDTIRVTQQFYPTFNIKIYRRYIYDKIY